MSRSFEDQEACDPTMFDVALEYAINNAEHEGARHHLREAWQLEIADRQVRDE